MFQPNLFKISIIDTLRRGTIKVTVAKVSETKEDQQNLQILASRGVKLVADTHLTDVHKDIFDCISLPGGLGGAKVFAKSNELIHMLKEQKLAGRIYSSICASPALVFSPHGILEGVSKATCYPSMQNLLPEFIDEDSKKQKVVVDGKCITSQGPCTAVEFALCIVGHLTDDSNANEVAKGMLFDLKQN
jgi:4-methyl-5(b-hydroxyethyl)-thiazole monophosphate biosynthesis